MMTNPQEQQNNHNMTMKSVVPCFIGGVEELPTIYPLKPKVMGGLCYDTLPKVYDDDWWVPVGEAWSMELTLLLTGYK